MKKFRKCLDLFVTLTVITALAISASLTASAVSPTPSNININNLPEDSITDKIDTEGWKYDPLTQTLTLDNANIGSIEFNTYSDKALNVVMAEGSVNTVNNTTNMYAINSNARMNFSGNGTLNVISNHRGIWGGEINFNGGIYNIKTTDAVIENDRGIVCDNLNINNKADVNIESGMIGIACTRKLDINESHFKVKADGVAFFILNGPVPNFVLSDYMTISGDGYKVINEDDISPLPLMYEKQGEHDTRPEGYRGFVFKNNSLSADVHPITYLEDFIEGRIGNNDPSLAGYAKVVEIGKAPAALQNSSVLDSIVSIVNPQTQSGMLVISAVVLCGMLAVCFVVVKKKEKR